jgi:hypothetical protein
LKTTFMECASQGMLQGCTERPRFFSGCGQLDEAEALIP